MVEDNPLGERGRALEEDYFRKRDRELIEKMRQASAVEDARRAMAAKTGLNDADLQELQALGFTTDTVTLLPLMPLVQVAWADGAVSDAERRLLVELARARGIAADSAADRQLATWLASRPDAAVFARASRLIAAMLAEPGAAQDAMTADDLIRYCERIAEASGGLLGFNRVSAEERALLASIARDLTARSR
jgi:hypothetical protein